LTLTAVDGALQSLIVVAIPDGDISVSGCSEHCLVDPNDAVPSEHWKENYLSVIDESSLAARYHNDEGLLAGLDEAVREQISKTTNDDPFLVHLNLRLEKLKGEFIELDFGLASSDFLLIDIKGSSC